MKFSLLLVFWFFFFPSNERHGVFWVEDHHSDCLPVHFYTSTVPSTFLKMWSFKNTAFCRICSRCGEVAFSNYILITSGVKQFVPIVLNFLNGCCNFSFSFFVDKLYCCYKCWLYVVLSHHLEYFIFCSRLLDFSSAN